MNDFTESLLDIQASPKILQEPIIHLSNHGHRLSRVGGWVIGMRVLMIHQFSSVETTSSEVECGLLEVQSHLSPFSPHVLTFNNSKFAIGSPFGFERAFHIYCGIVLVK